MGEAAEGNQPRWTVAVTLVKSIPDGLNVQTVLSIVKARSKPEAEGIAARSARQDNPQHLIHTMLAVEIPDA